MKNTWIIFVANRYLKTKRKEKGISTSFLSIIGILVGTMALISVMSVMNGFQVGPIEDTLEIGSYHLRIENPPENDDHIIQAVSDLDGVRAVLPFRDSQTMIKGRVSTYGVAQIRGVPANTPELDAGLISQLQIEPGEFDLSRPDHIILADGLAASLGVFEGDQVDVVMLGGGGFGSLSTMTQTFTVSGVFSCGYQEYDNFLAYVSDEAEIFTSQDKPVIGVKLDDRYDDRYYRHLIEDMVEDVQVISWRNFNRSYFGALRMEKMTLFVLIALIILVVGVNIFNSLRRTVFERREEIGLLRSVGASPLQARTIFVFEGALIGLIGGGLGVISGLLVTLHINEILSFLEAGVFLILQWTDSLLMQFGIYNEYIQYLLGQPYLLMKDLPVKIELKEIWFVFIYALISSVMAAFFASRQISQIKPSEVLRYE